MITFNFEGIKRPEFLRRLTSAWIRLVAARHGKKVGNITYLFCSEEKMLETNRTYLQHDYYTDIITFDNSEGDTIAGDIIIAPETVRSNAAKYGTTFREELRRVIIHGILHLCGIDDKAPGAREIMERHENEALDLFRKMTDKGPKKPKETKEAKEPK